jgi:hypothetical protein
MTKQARKELDDYLDQIDSLVKDVNEAASELRKVVEDAKQRRLTIREGEAS